MQIRTLGRDGPTVSALGLGCMGMSAFYGGRGSDADAIAVIHRALERGVTLLDTADMYGPHTNEVLVGKAIAGRRDQVFLATKFGIKLEPSDTAARSVDGRPEYVIAACEASLQRLGVDHIDLYYQHRVDGTVPIEDTVGAMARLVEQGKVRAIGASNYSAERLRDALRVSADYKLPRYETLQPEYNLYDRAGYESGLEAVVREAQLGVISYYSLASGFLSGKYRSAADAGKSSARGQSVVDKYVNPRGLRILTALDDVASAHGVSPSQVAIAWLIARPGIT